MKLIRDLLGILAGLILIGGFALADTRDYTDDFEAYAMAVSQLGNDRVSIASVGEQAWTTVLCRGDGRALDFDALGVFPRAALAGPFGLYTLDFDTAEEAALAVERLKEASGVLYAELDGEVRACEERDDALTFNSHGAAEMGYAAYLPYVSGLARGEVVVAVIDSGVAPHPMLSGRLTESGPDYIDGDDDATNDEHGHGTHVAGIVADCTRGLNVKICPVRALNASGKGSLSNVANGVRAATLRGVDVINLSIEANASDALDDAVRDALSAGVIVTVAAGNHAKSTAEVSPARLTERGVIVVASAEGTVGSYTRASYSNFGASVDVFAPGTGIVSCANDGGFTSKSGTSQATPHISALCAMLRLIHPAMSPAEAEARVRVAAVGEGVAVPALDGIIPKNAGFSLEKVTLCLGDSMTLSPSALPLTARERVTYASNDEAVVSVSGGALSALSAGTALVTAHCVGFDLSFEIVVTDSAMATLALPGALTDVESEAFSGGAFERAVLGEGVTALGDDVFAGCGALKLVELPESLETIGQNDFSGAVALVRLNSPAHLWAEESGVSYIATTE